MSYFPILDIDSPRSLSTCTQSSSPKQGCWTPTVACLKKLPVIMRPTGNTQARGPSPGRLECRRAESLASSWSRNCEPKNDSKSLSFIPNVRFSMFLISRDLDCRTGPGLRKTFRPWCEAGCKARWNTRTRLRAGACEGGLAAHCHRIGRGAGGTEGRFSVQGGGGYGAEDTA